MTGGLPFSNISIGIYGRNLAILHKNVRTSILGCYLFF